MQSTNVSCALQEIIEIKSTDDQIGASPPNEVAEGTEDVKTNDDKTNDEISAATDLLYIFFACQMVFQTFFAIGVFWMFYSIVLDERAEKLSGKAR